MIDNNCTTLTLLDSDVKDNYIKFTYYFCQECSTCQIYLIYLDDINNESNNINYLAYYWEKWSCKRINRKTDTIAVY